MNVKIQGVLLEIIGNNLAAVVDLSKPTKITRRATY